MSSGSDHEISESVLLSIAKITGPRLPDVLPRDRLFKLLDQAVEKPAIWVQAPAGAGKTTLVASWLTERNLPTLWHQIDERDSDPASFIYYLGLAAKKAAPRRRRPLPLLTPEYLPGIRIFTKKYFEALYSRLKSPSIIVFDNYQEALAESQLHQVICEGVNAVPPGVNIVFISRNAPPAAMVCLKARRQLATIGWDDIRLTLEEIAGLVALRGENAAEETVRRLHEITHGWTAGVILLMERMRCPGDILSIPATDDLAEIFDYFAEELFAKVSPEVRDFLMKSSFLPKMTAIMAERVTGFDGAERLLSHLVRNSYFTQRHEHFNPVYQYHPLFREFLLSRAREIIPIDKISRIKRHAAELLVEKGEFDEAMKLLSDSGDWAGLTKLVLNQAQALLAQGRVQTLVIWLELIPREVTETTPWLLYWFGTCKMPAEALAFFERAFRLFNEQGDEEGTLMAWSGAVEALVIEFNDFRAVDRWIDWLDERLRQTSAFPAAEIEAAVAVSMANALLWRRPDHPFIAQWVSRALSVSREINEILRLKTLHIAGLYYLWVGDFIGARYVMEELGNMAGSATALPLYRIYSKSIEAHCNISLLNNPERAVEAIEEGLGVAVESGLHTMDHMLLAQGVYGALITGDAALSGQYLKKLEAALAPSHRESNPTEGASYDHPYYRAPYVIMGQYYHLASLYQLLDGDIFAAELAAEKALAMTEAAGVPMPHAMCRIASAQVAFEKGDYKRAFSELDAAESYILHSGTEYFEFTCHLARAYFNYSMGKETDGARALGRGMTYGRQKGFTDAPVLWRPPVITRLCAEALKAGIEVEYVQNLIRGKRLAPDARAMDLENWPWVVRVFTLGGFRLLLDGKPVEFSGKIQEKPLSLLKAIIALGGRAVPEERLCDLLWHSADGDAAYRAFATNLHRLRRLLGNEKAILSKGGRVTVNQSMVWVDALAFEKLSHDHRSLVNNESLLERAMALYSGHFLAEETNAHWVVSMRERLRSRFLGIVMESGLSLEKNDQWERAAECYRRGIEADEVLEEFYQRLMICYSRLGRRGQAVALYRQCCHSLAMIGLKPTVSTRAIYSELTADSAR